MSSVMDNAVKEICTSLLNNPNRWEVTTYTLDDKYSGIRYWIDDKTIVKTWNGRSNDVVFTREQGREIFQAYEKMKADKATQAQGKVLNSFKIKSDDTRGWWEFWK